MAPEERRKRNAKRRRERAPEKIKAYRRANQRRLTLAKFGITEEEFDRRYATQDGKCGICGRAPSGDDRYKEGKSLAVDHNHTTDKVRGLLCDSCNRGSGQFKDNPVLLQKASDWMSEVSTLNVFQLVERATDPRLWFAS